MPLSHVCVWDADIGYKRISLESACKMYPNGASAKSGYFVCELCAQNVLLTAPGVNVRHFRHDPSSPNKECDERQAHFDPLYGRRLRNLNSHLMPLRITVAKESFALQMGFFCPPDSEARCDKIRITTNSGKAYEYSFERIERGGTNKKSIHGAKIHRMALSNLGRNKKRTILVIISMTLSLVLFNTVFTLASGFDVEKYVEKFVNKDFIISTADYFNFKFGNSDSKNDLSTSFIEAVKQNPAFDEGGELYTTKILEEAFSVENGVTSNYNKDAEGNPLVQLYGADDFLLNSMDVIEGTIDWEALKSGNYVLYALTADDNGNIIDDPNIHVGDTLHFNHVQMNGLSSSIDNNFDCKVMAKVLINENTDTIRSTGFAKFYMPTDVFLPLCEQPHLVSFPFNVVDGMEADMEEFLSSYVEDIEPSMNYDSKQTYINSFNDLTSLIITIGGALSIIIGLIGITNFVNSVLTSIITRRKELAMLQSIGMTGKQLKKMLSFEGLYYACLLYTSDAADE